MQVIIAAVINLPQVSKFQVNFNSLPRFRLILILRHYHLKLCSSGTTRRKISNYGKAFRQPTVPTEQYRIAVINNSTSKLELAPI